MMTIIKADLCSNNYKEFKDWLLKEWDDIEYLPECDEPLTTPSTLLAFRDEQLVGGLTFINYKHPNDESNALWINTVYVKETNRGRGIASRLINQAVKAAVDYGTSELFVFTKFKGLYLKNEWQLISEDQGDFILEKLLPH